jgi:hypothetical protein
MIKSRRMRWAEHVVRTGEMRNVYKSLVGYPERDRPLARPKSKWEGNIKMHLREIGVAGVDWIHMAQDRDRWRALVNTVMNLRVPYREGALCLAERTIRFSIRTLLHGVS